MVLVLIEGLAEISIFNWNGIRRTRRLHFFILGEPRPTGSRIHGRGGRIKDTDDVKSSRAVLMISKRCWRQNAMTVSPVCMSFGWNGKVL